MLSGICRLLKNESILNDRATSRTNDSISLNPDTTRVLTAAEEINRRSNGPVTMEPDAAVGIKHTNRIVKLAP